MELVGENSGRVGWVKFRLHVAFSYTTVESSNHHNEMTLVYKYIMRCSD